MNYWHGGGDHAGPPRFPWHALAAAIRRAAPVAVIVSVLTVLGAAVWLAVQLTS